MGDRLRARQSIYSCVLSARCCFSVAYIFLHSPPSHMASQWLRNSGGGWMQRVEVEEVEPDGLDSTWAPGDQPRSVLSSSATITGSPAPSPFLWGEEAPRPQGISLPLASLLRPLSGLLPWTCTKQEKARWPRPCHSPAVPPGASACPSLRQISRPVKPQQ